jgi:branched-chain amino acid transport system permease protein
MEYLIHIAIIVSLYAAGAMSLNLIVGETGLVSVAHAAFVGIGGYAVALLLTVAHVPFVVAILVAVLISGIVAFFIGATFLRLREVYYVLGTVGFNVIVLSIFLNWSSLTKGPLGIAGIPRPEIFGAQLSTNISFLVLALIFVLCVYFCSSFITRSSLGRALHAIREDEAVAEVFGYSTVHYKLFVFTTASMLAGAAGALYASYISYISPYGYAVTESIFVLAIIILGGLGSARGAILGAALLVILPELLRFVGFPPEIAAQLRLGSYGLVLVLFMLYRPQGIWGTFKI